MTTARDIDTDTVQLLCCLDENGVATITLNRPEVRNALSDELTPALRRMIKKLGDRDDVGSLLITGAGTAFCAGGDVKGMGASGNGPKRPEADQVADLRERQRTLTGRLYHFPHPTIAALPGAAAGAGLAIALACDLRLVASSAFVTTGYARVGLSGDYGLSWLLPRLVGAARARELMFTGERIDAERCLAMGIANHVVEDNELAGEALALATSLACGPRKALKLMKENLIDAATSEFFEALDGEASRLVQSAGTADHKEAVRAFIEKRDPNFQKS